MENQDPVQTPPETPATIPERIPEPVVANKPTPAAEALALQIQRLGRAPQIVVHDMSQWESKWTPRDENGITDIITHHTVMDQNSTPAAIDAADVSQGFDGAGYNYYIDGQGIVYVLRKIEYEPAAALGRNMQSINIALGGDFTKELPNRQQQSAWFWLAGHLLLGMVPTSQTSFAQRGFKIERVIGHGDVAELFYANDDPGNFATECPGRTFRPVLNTVWKPQLRSITGKDFS